MPVDQTPYEERGYANRREYVRDLASEYGVDEAEAFALASLLGPTEDFDGLLSALEDISC